MAPSAELVKQHKFKVNELKIRPLTVQENQYDEDFPTRPSDSESEDDNSSGIVRSPSGPIKIHDAPLALPH